MQRLMENYRAQREAQIKSLNSPSWMLLIVIITGSLFIALLSYQLL
jgi:hypothetical protein